MEGSDVENEQINDSPLPSHSSSYPYLPPHYPPPNDDPNSWPEPHPYPPCPYHCFYSDYDSQNLGVCHQLKSSCSISRDSSQELPNIIVTPSGDDLSPSVNSNQSGRQKRKIEKITKECSVVDRSKREGSVIDMLSQKLSEIVKPGELDLNLSKDDKPYMGDNGKNMINPPSPSKSEYENSKVRHNSTEDLLSSSDSLLSSCEEGLKKESHESHNRLQAIKSVTNIKIYGELENGDEDEKQTEDDDQTIADDESEMMDEEVEEEVDDEECYLVEEMEEDDLEIDDEEVTEEITDEIDEVFINANELSIIYEESEAERASRNTRAASCNSSNQSFSDSTTIANDDEVGVNEENENIEDIEMDQNDDDDDDDNSNLVTVSLPLKLSFSRSSNDESITTVEVGRSHIKDEVLEIQKPFVISSASKPDYKDEESDNDCDVSVTISLAPSKNNSFNSRKSFSIDKETIESDEDDVSVSFSLPVKKNNSKKLSSDHIAKINSVAKCESNSEVTVTLRNKDSKAAQKPKNRYTYAFEQIEEPQSIEDFWETLDTSKTEPKVETFQDDSEIRRNNYKKAMAFFVTSIDVDTPTENTLKEYKRSNSTTRELENSTPSKGDIQPARLLESRKRSKSTTRELDNQTPSKTDSPPAKSLDSWKRSNSITRELEITIPLKKETPTTKHLESWKRSNSNTRELENPTPCKADKQPAGPLESWKRSNSTTCELENLTPSKTDSSLANPLDSWKRSDSITRELESPIPPKKETPPTKHLELWKRSNSTTRELENPCKADKQPAGLLESWKRSNPFSREFENPSPSKVETLPAKILDSWKRSKSTTRELENQSNLFKIDNESDSTFVSWKRSKSTTKEMDRHSNYKTWSWKTSDSKEDISTEYIPTNNKKEADLSKMIDEPKILEAKIKNGVQNIETKKNSFEGLIPENKYGEKVKVCVKDRISAFETIATDMPTSNTSKTNLDVEQSSSQKTLSRNSSQRSESEIEEDDSGVTDMKLQSETDTESECFPELRKMTRYQRAATHSRLFKLLQGDDGDDDENSTVVEDNKVKEDQTAKKLLEEEFNFKPRKKIVHNVSITRKQNPDAVKKAETMNERRERLSLPLRKNISIDADNPSSPNSPASPLPNPNIVTDQLVTELVRSLLLKNSSKHLSTLPMEKLQAAAKRVLEEELDSLENTSLESTPALTPQDLNTDSYSDYYDSWRSSFDDSDTNADYEILPSKAFRVLQESSAGRRKPWSVRCPRVLSSKKVNRDLARVTESPEIYRSTNAHRSSQTPEKSELQSSRSGSSSRWDKFSAF